MEIISWIIIIVLVVIIIYLFILLMRALNRIELYEGWIFDAKDTIKDAYLLMRKVDILGSFEASDEVGQSFKALLHISNQLNNQINPEISNEVLDGERSKQQENKISSGAARTK